MMIEELGIFSDDQAIGFDQGGGTGPALTLSTNKYDMQNRRDLPDGLFVEFRVTEAFTVGGGTPTLQFGIMAADDALLAGNATCLLLCGGLTPLLGIGVELVATPVLVAAQLLEGLSVYAPLPRASVLVSAKTGNSGGVRAALQRYIGACYYQPSWSTSYFSSGRMSARLVAMPTRADFGPDSF